MTHRLAWAGAVLFFGVGDVLTTVVALDLGAVELNPVAAGLGAAELVGLKLLALLLLYACYRALPRYKLAVPVSLTVLGLAIVLWNLTILILLLKGG